MTMQPELAGMPASSSIDEILAQFLFGDFREVDTRAGKRLVRSGPIPGHARQAFWNSWNTQKPEWAARGFSISKYGGDWQLAQWLNPDGTLTEQAKRKAAEERANMGEGALPCDWEPDDVRLNTEQAAKLYEWQRPGALRLVRALMGKTPPAGINEQQSAIFAGLNGNALDASATGTGKTFIGLTAAAELGMRPCVIAPLAVLPSWQRAASFLGVQLGFVVNYEKLKAGNTGLGKFLPSGEWQWTYLPKNPLLIWDEIQKAKALDTKNSAMVRGSVGSRLKCLGLSATAAKDPTEMRAVGMMLGMHDGSLTNFKAWCKLNGCEETRYGLQYRERKKKQGLERLHRQIFPLKGNRIRIEDVPEFPETQILAEALDTGNTQDIAGAYDEAERMIAELAENRDIDGRERQAQGLAAIMKARIAAEKGKLDLFVQLAEDAIEEDESVVIFLNFRAHIAELAERLKTDCLVWGTDMEGRAQKPDERQRNIDRFQSDERRICIVSLQAGGAGLSLHDLTGEHPRLALISPSFSCVDIVQALGRVNRAGGKTKSRQRVIFAANVPIEEDICKSVTEKLENISALNDGDLAPRCFLRNLADDISGGQSDLTQ